MNPKREAMRKKYNNALARFCKENGKAEHEKTYVEIMGKKELIDNKIVLTIEFESETKEFMQLQYLLMARQRVLIDGVSFIPESMSAKRDGSTVFKLASRY